MCDKHYRFNVVITIANKSWQFKQHTCTRDFLNGDGQNGKSDVPT